MPYTNAKIAIGVVITVVLLAMIVLTALLCGGTIKPYSKELANMNFRNGVENLKSMGWTVAGKSNIKNNQKLIEERHLAPQWFTGLQDGSIVTANYKQPRLHTDEHIFMKLDELYSQYDPDKYQLSTEPFHIYIPHVYKDLHITDYTVGYNDNDHIVLNNPAWDGSTTPSLSYQ